MRQRIHLSRRGAVARHVQACADQGRAPRAWPARAAPGDRRASPCRCRRARRAARRDACARQRRLAPAPAPPPRDQQRRRVSRGCGKPSRRSASGSASISWAAAAARAISAGPAASDGARPAPGPRRRWLPRVAVPSSTWQRRGSALATARKPSRSRVVVSPDRASRRRRRPRRTRPAPDGAWWRGSRPTSAGTSSMNVRSG